MKKGKDFGPPRRLLDAADDTHRNMGVFCPPDGVTPPSFVSPAAVCLGTTRARREKAPSTSLPLTFPYTPLPRTCLPSTDSFLEGMSGYVSFSISSVCLILFVYFYFVLFWWNDDLFSFNVSLLFYCFFLYLFAYDMDFLVSILFFFFVIIFLVLLLGFSFRYLLHPRRLRFTSLAVYLCVCVSACLVSLSSFHCYHHFHHRFFLFFSIRLHLLSHLREADVDLPALLLP